MATKKSRKPAKKVKSLRAKTLDAKQAKRVKGGGTTKGDKAKLSDFTFSHVYDKSSP